MRMPLRSTSAVASTARIATPCVPSILIATEDVETLAAAAKRELSTVLCAPVSSANAVVRPLTVTGTRDTPAQLS